MKSTVRRAVPGDYDALLKLLRLKHEEDGIGKFDAAKAMMSVERGISGFRAIIGVIRGRTGIEASIGLFMGAPWDSGDDYLSDRWAFVHPEFRRSEHAKNLLMFAKWASTELMCPLVMTTMLNEITANKAKLYERQLPKAGEVFVFMPDVAPDAKIAQYASNVHLTRRQVTFPSITKQSLPVVSKARRWMTNGVDISRKPASVHIATQADELPLFDLLWVEMFKDNYLGYERCEKKVVETISAVCRGKLGVAGVIYNPDGDGRIVGSTAIVACQPWYSDVWYLSEVWLFVMPEYRKYGYGKDLFNFSKWHRDDMEARTGTQYNMECSVQSHTRLATKEKIWSRHGTKVSASFYLDRNY